ncbi:MAG: cytochrome P450 [Candidatus Omnitrophota bacterium]|nr:cytochrome P450 [Candidatus Omnitrophota bacterium]
MRVATAPPGPKGKPFVGHLFAFRRDPTGFLLGLARDYGDIVYFKFGPWHAFLLNNPSEIEAVLVTHHDQFVKGRGLVRAKGLLGEGLLTSEGTFHRRQRQLVQPAFHRQQVTTYAEVMTRCTAHLLERWQDGATMDIAKEMRHLTLAIAGQALFHADLEPEVEEINEALTSFMDAWYTLMLPFSELLERLPLPSTRRFQAARTRLNATVSGLVRKRQTQHHEGADALSLLLEARDSCGSEYRLTDRQVHDEVMTLLLAGHETTANALSWTWYLLAQHPDVERVLHTELDTVLAGRPPTVNDVEHLRYTRMVLAEAMRLYPPAWIIGRQAIRECAIGIYRVPKHAVVFLSPYVTQRDPRYFPDPDRFDPQRWTPDAQAARPRFSYFPFGGGPRQCLGEPFAWMEGIVVIATVAQRWRMRLIPGHPVTPHPRLTLRPKDGIGVILEHRKPTSAHSCQ